MNEKEVIEVLILVKSIWPKTSVHDVVVNVWTDLLNGIDYDAMKLAVKAFALLPEQTDPPHIGALIDYARRHSASVASIRRRLPEPPPTEEEIADAKRQLREMIDSIGKTGR